VTTPLLAIVPVGECRFCGCTREHSCKVPGGDECAFLDAKATRCNHPRCIALFEAEERKEIDNWKARQRMQAELRAKDRKRKRSTQRRAA
jgi:hypothetical protein